MSQIVDDLRQVAIEIKTETQVGGNTAARVGGAFERVADALEGTQQIEDMDAAVAAVQQAAQENEQTIQNIVNSLAVVQTTGQSTSSVMSQKAVTDELYESEIINLNNYSTLGQWIRDSDRKWATSSAVNCKIVPVSPNTNYIIIPISSTKPSRFCFLQSDAHTISSTPSFCDGYSKQDVYVTESFKVKSPSNAHYIYFCFQPSDQYNIKLPQQFSVVIEKYASDVEVGNTLDSDFDITDETGNVLVRFYEGHIKTKNFDSIDYYGVIDKFKGKHLVIIGDSISTYGGYIPTGWRTYYTNNNLSSVNNTYWMKLCMMLGMSYNNCSYSASRVSGDSTAISVTGAADECAGCSDVRINAINRDGKTPDIILVYMGTNDWINNVSLGEYNSSSSLPNEGVISTFSPAYALMLAKIRNNYPQAIIFCCTMPTNASKQSAPPFINAKGIAVEDYNGEIRKIANIFGCNVLELANCGLNYKSIPSLSVDNVLHPNVGGHTLMFKKVLTELISNY